jgi:hypothetical protein
MTIFISLIAILQSFSISLGVGSSTLAIINFFVAIFDGKIDETERRMMGVAYIVLRVAMVFILLTTISLLSVEASGRGVFGLSAFSLAQLIIIMVLFINAMLMTARLMPSTFGPAIQAGSWYTLGTLAAFVPLGLVGFSLTQFLLGYLTFIVLAVSIVNGVMAVIKHRKRIT